MEKPGRPAGPARPKPETAGFIAIGSPDNPRRRIQAQTAILLFAWLMWTQRRVPMTSKFSSNPSY